MKFSCEKIILLTAILTSARAASAKSPVSALEGLLITTEDNIVTITGYDLKLGIITTIEADVEETGSIVLNARLISDIIRKLPGDFVTISSKDGYLTRIKCEMSDYELIATPAIDYPELPSIENQAAIEIGENVLKQMINQTNFAVSDNESRMIHTGALFEIKEGVLTIVAVDGYRMAIRRTKIEGEVVPDNSFVVPGHALGEVEKITTDEDRSLTINVGAKHIMFDIGGTIVITRRLEGDFINYRNSIPQSAKYNLVGVRRELIEAVERVSLILNDKIKSPLKCTFTDKRVRFNTASSHGRASDECAIEGDGEELEIGFNNKYLLEILKAAPENEVAFRLTTGVTPCIIAPVDGGDSFLYLILPVRLTADED